MVLNAAAVHSSLPQPGSTGRPGCIPATGGKHLVTGVQLGLLGMLCCNLSNCVDPEKLLEIHRDSQKIHPGSQTIHWGWITFQKFSRVFVNYVGVIFYLQNFHSVHPVLPRLGHKQGVSFMVKFPSNKRKALAFQGFGIDENFRQFCHTNRCFLSSLYKLTMFCPTKQCTFIHGLLQSIYTLKESYKSSWLIHPQRFKLFCYCCATSEVVLQDQDFRLR